jgi:hypothetical protein
MKETLKKIAIAGAGTMLVAGVAFAGTGYGSHEENEFSWTNHARVEVDNDADIDNDVDAHLNTGENEANFNGGEEDPSISSGDASATVSVSNTANQATVDVTAPDMSFPEMENSENTGAYSRSENEVRMSNDTCIEIRNDADIDNDVDLHVNTGGNEAKFNSGEVSISTGSASANVSISNNVNTANVSVK